MKVFVTGSSGYIGRRILSEMNDVVNVKKISSKENTDAIFLNLENANEFDYNVVEKNDIVIFLSAISSPDVCKNRYDFAYKINVEGTKRFIEKVIERGARVLFFSSDTVYGKQEGVLDENSETNALEPYAFMKRYIEKEFEGEKLFKVFRLSYVFSKDDKFTTYLRQCSLNKEEAEIFHPLYRSAVYIEDLKEAILKIAKEWELWNQQIFNICGSENLSRIDMANIYKSVVDNKIELKIVEPEEEFFAARPKIINVKSVFLQKLLGRDLTSIENAMIAEFKK